MPGKLLVKSKVLEPWGIQRGITGSLISTEVHLLDICGPEIHLNEENFPSGLSDKRQSH